MSTLLVNNIRTFSGTTIFITGSDILMKGKTTLGDETGDHVAIAGRISSSLMPIASNNYTLGGGAYIWKGIKASTASIQIISQSSGFTELRVEPAISGSTIKLNGHQSTEAVGPTNGGVDGNLIPVNSAAPLNLTTNATLGTPQRRWNGIFHTSSFVTISSSLIPNADDTFNIGSTTKRWDTAFINRIDQDIIIETASFGTISSSLIPIRDDEYDLGASNRQWRNLYIDGIANVDTLTGVQVANIDTGSITLLGMDHGTVSGSFIPNQDDTFNLGSGAKQWKELHVRSVSASGAINVAGMPTSEAAAQSGELFTLSGSQIFSSSAFPGGSQPVFASGDFSASLFVFQKA